MLSRPNIIQIVVDDMGVGDLSCYNRHRSQTYRLDALLSEGVGCAQQYSSSPVCMPARASLLTGRYPQRVGCIDLPQHRPHCFVDPDVPCIAEHLTAAGYQTAAIGKWHTGTGRAHPARRGFQETLTFQGGMMDYWRWNLDVDGVYHKYADGRYLTDVFSDAACDFVVRHRDQPFFLHLAYNAPHTPYQAPEADIELFRKGGLFNESVCILYAMLRRVDAGIEQLLDCLRRLGLEENTLIWFTSDNGAVQDQRMQRFNCSMRGGKCSVWEGGIRVPSIVRWPAGGLSGGRCCDELVHFTDLMPTLCAAAGAPLPPDADIDGENVLPLLQGGRREAQPMRFWQWTHYDVQPMHNAAVRDGSWKLVSPACGSYVINVADGGDLFGLDLNMLSNAETPAKSGLQLPPGFADHDAYYHFLLERARAPRPDCERYEPLPPQLFDLNADPSETRNLSDQHPEIAGRLRRELENWFDRLLPDVDRYRQAV